MVAKKNKLAELVVMWKRKTGGWIGCWIAETRGCKKNEVVGEIGGRKWLRKAVGWKVGLAGENDDGRHEQNSWLFELAGESMNKVVGGVSTMVVNAGQQCYVQRQKKTEVRHQK